ncbi:MAG: DUF3853 family protein [Bacteroidales bacterium]|nr:DUF3853 family protein [Bacteroidales bacterium]
METSTRIIDITLADLQSVVRSAVQQVLAERDAAEVTRADLPRYLYGIPGVMQLFNCSRSTANRIIKSGIIDAAISQVGAKRVIDTDKALKIYKSKYNY